ncbi:MAG: non-ribosomal peptide synthetase, partial [bacterium]|nr:non-ribosomal peptide synthetase [bacterium]
MGRIDSQVKIRGYRIEMGEIESWMLAYGEIKEAVVEVFEVNGTKSLCAYYVGGNTQQSESGLRDNLTQYLPAYMIPGTFIRLEKMPLTSNGKIDRKALPAPEIKSTGGYEAPAGPVEKALTGVWQQVLKPGGNHRIGVNDNYFSLGGDSIKTIQIAARLRKYGYKMEVKEIFTHQTIRQLAPRIKKISRKSTQEAVTGTVPLTAIQRWFFQAALAGKTHFNQTVMIYREEGFDETKLQKVFTKIVRHHDALRMVYEGAGSMVIQRNRGIEGGLFHLEKIDLTNNTETDIRKKIPEISTRKQSEFNLETGPLVKLI